MFSNSYQRQQSQDETIFNTDFLYSSGQEAGTPESNVPKESADNALHRVDAAGREEPVAAESLLSQSNLRSTSRISGKSVELSIQDHTFLITGQLMVSTWHRQNKLDHQL